MDRGQRGKRQRMSFEQSDMLQIQKRQTPTLVLEELNISDLGTGGGIAVKAIELNEN